MLSNTKRIYTSDFFSPFIVEVTIHEVWSVYIPTYLGCVFCGSPSDMVIGRSCNYKHSARFNPLPPRILTTIFDPSRTSRLPAVKNGQPSAYVTSCKDLLR